MVRWFLEKREYSVVAVFEKNIISMGVIMAIFMYSFNLTVLMLMAACSGWGQAMGSFLSYHPRK
jgi:hypothetical protein